MAQLYRSSGTVGSQKKWHYLTVIRSETGTPIKHSIVNPSLLRLTIDYEVSDALIPAAEGGAWMRAVWVLWEAREASPRSDTLSCCARSGLLAAIVDPAP